MKYLSSLDCNDTVISPCADRFFRDHCSDLRVVYLQDQFSDEGIHPAYLDLLATYAPRVTHLVLITNTWKRAGLRLPPSVTHLGLYAYWPNFPGCLSVDDLQALSGSEGSALTVVRYLNLDGMMARRFTSRDPGAARAAGLGFRVEDEKGELIYE